MHSHTVHSVYVQPHSTFSFFVVPDYHDGKSLLNMEDLSSGLLGPYDEGAQGVVIWGSSEESNKEDFLTVYTMRSTSTYWYNYTCVYTCKTSC